MKKSTIALVFALALAVLAVIAVRKYLVEQTQKIEKGTKTVPILVADALIKPGDSLSENQVKVKKIVESSLLPEMILATEKRQYLGKQAIKEIRRDNTLLKQYFRTEAVERGMTVVAGQRVATVNVNPVTGVAGLLSPGDHVDVVYTLRGTGQGGRGATATTLTVFNDVIVFAVDVITRIAHRAMRGRSRRTGSQYSTVSLLLYPQEVELIVFAAASGEITLVKRSNTDGVSKRLPGVDPSTFRSQVEEAQRIRGGN